MSEREWAYVRITAVALASIASVHGLTSRQWRDAHSVAVAVALVAVLAERLQA